MIHARFRSADFSALARGGSSGAAVWAGPWEVERVDGPHGPQWAVAPAVPNRLRLAEKGKGASFLALAVESLDAEELPILGRALMRRVEGVAVA